VSYRGGVGKINFADEGRKRTRKKGKPSEGQGGMTEVQDGCGAGRVD